LSGVHIRRRVVTVDAMPSHIVRVCQYHTFAGLLVESASQYQDIVVSVGV